MYSRFQNLEREREVLTGPLNELLDKKIRYCDCFLDIVIGWIFYVKPIFEI